MKKVNGRYGYFALVVTGLILAACNGSLSQPSGGVSQPATSGNPVANASSSPLPSDTRNPEWPPPPVPTDAQGRQLISPVPTGSAWSFDSPTPVSVAMDTPESKIRPELSKAMADNPDDVHFDVLLVGQPAPGRNLDAMSQQDRAQYLYNLEIQTAAQTQPAVKAALDKLQSEGQVHSYSALTIVNAFVIKGTAKAVKVLAERSDIKLLEWDAPLQKPSDKITPNQP